jgi:hypothetical protein
MSVKVSDEVERTFAKALSVKPEDRFQSVAEFWRALVDGGARGPTLHGAR